MHIPDGLLSLEVTIPAAAVSAGVIAWGIKRTQLKLDEKHIPIVGVLSAFVFAAQMLNFPIFVGPSGHFMGGALCGILLGPFLGSIVITVVLIVQCLIFADGGLLALGANVFNMAIVGSFSAYYSYKLIKNIAKNSNIVWYIAIFLSAWISLVLASVFCSIEIALTGSKSIWTILPAMAGVHALIGVGEGIITTFVILFINKIRGDILQLVKI
jgi:cobalt/nickel transport system permease protein